MKTSQYVSFFALSFITCLSFGQVGIGTTTPNASLEIIANNPSAPASNEGILIPKVLEFPSVDPSSDQDGMMLFATGGGSVTRGFYYWDNATTSWVSLAGVSIERINDLTDGKSDNDGTDNGSSIFFGVNAGASDDSSNNANVGMGYGSMTNTTTGQRNTAIGYESLYTNTTGFDNYAFGYRSLYSNTTGLGNIAMGYLNLYSNATGNGNIAIGRRALFDNTTGSYNVAAGYLSLFNNTTGTYNVGLGASALINLVDGSYNVALGPNTLQSLNSGSNNTAVGYRAGNNNTGANNLFLGAYAGHTSGGVSNRLYVETVNTPQIR